MNQQRVSRREEAEFCRQFSAMQRANVNILDVLSTLREQTPNEWFGQILASVRRDVELGRSLASAFSRFPADFSPFFIRMVRQGEIEGVLDQVLVSLAQHLDREGEGFPMREAAGTPQDLATIMEQLRPLLFKVTIAAGVLTVGAAILGYLHILGLITQQVLGPNILLLAGAGILFFALIFLRYKPPRVARCSFCGRSESQAGEMVAGEGVNICESCISTSVRQLRQVSPEPVASQASPAAPETAQVPPPTAPLAEGDEGIKIIEL